MYFYVCMECGCEWETDIETNSCPRCKVGDIYCYDVLEEDNNDNQEQRTEKDVKRKGQTIYDNNVYK